MAGFLWGKKNIIIFQKEKGNTFTLLIILIVKSLQKEQNSTNLLLSAGINLQSPQSDSTPWTLTLVRLHSAHWCVFYNLKETRTDKKISGFLKSQVNFVNFYLYLNFRRHWAKIWPYLWAFRPNSTYEKKSGYSAFFMLFGLIAQK